MGWCTWARHEVTRAVSRVFNISVQSQIDRKNRVVTQADFWKTHPKPERPPNHEFWVMTQTDSWKTRPNQIF